MDIENVSDPFASKPKIRRDENDDIEMTTERPSNFINHANSFTKITTDERLVKSFIRQTVSDAEKSVIREAADTQKAFVQENANNDKSVSRQPSNVEKSILQEETITNEINKDKEIVNQTRDDFTTPKGLHHTLELFFRLH